MQFMMKGTLTPANVVHYSTRQSNYKENNSDKICIQKFKIFVFVHNSRSERKKGDNASTI